MRNTSRQPSTTYEWRLVRVRPGAAGQGQALSEAKLRHALPSRPSRQPLTVVIRHRGGPESWWEIQARGAVWRFPGYVGLDDAMSRINRLSS